MPGLIKSSLCYKYSYPLGMINNLISGIYDFCSEDTSKEGKCDEKETIMDCHNLNQSVARIVKNHINLIETEEQ